MLITKDSYATKCAMVTAAAPLFMMLMAGLIVFACGMALISR
ncbi:MAG TPA: hypothetical protein VGJ90_00315 [Methylophilaceae bacterium]